MKTVIVGATSGIAKACARIWANEPNAELVLIGRNQQSLDRVAADIKVRAPGASITTYALDLTNPYEVEDLEQKLALTGQIDRVLVAQGELTEQRSAETSSSILANSVTINATSVALFAELAARLMATNSAGSIILIGSVAGDRGRRSNYTYGASKAFVDTYARGMQHRLAVTGIRVSLVKPGPTATPMTAGLSGYNKMASPDQVAREIVAASAKGKDVLYTPRIWKLVMLVVRNIPSAIFNRINF